jgi:2-polyprenyl-6-methoxyphenol hydroxylase-like FAD-dependent oxidoreductase
MEMSAQSESDLLILGAGPAGCAAAITALENGCRVTLLERRFQPKQHPGETLHPGVEPIFRMLGVWDAVLKYGFHRHRGIWREPHGQPRTFTPYGEDEHGPWLGFQVDRTVLNNLLRARVTELGGKIVGTAHLERVLKRGDSVAGVSADGHRYAASVVLDATGRHSWLAQQLALKPERHEPFQRLHFGWMESGDPDLDEQPLFRETETGWDWLSPISGTRCAWVKLQHASAGSGVDYTCRIYRQCAGDGYLLLGDSACLLDPSAANGVLRALMSGIYAGSLLNATRLHGISSEQMSREYQRWIAELFDRSLAAMRKESPAAEAHLHA